jgi:hypothetical protein
MLAAVRWERGMVETMEEGVPAGAEVVTRSFVLATVLSVSMAQTALTVSLILLLG